MQHVNPSRLGMRALIVNSDLRLDTAAGRAARALAEDLRGRFVNVVETDSLDDGAAIAAADAAIQAALVDWDVPGDDGHRGAETLVAAIRARSADLPIFLSADRSEAASLPLDVLSQIDEFVWLTDDTPAFISGRIVAAIERYREGVLPPMFAALARFARVHEYSWHTPGHTGGTAFLKHPAGRAFFEYFGENLLRSDLSISVGELGSLLDHTGAIGAGERYAARVFGAHRSYTVTNGSSTSNRVILMASVTRGQVALCDRNCHKSAEHAMTLSGAIPVWMTPSRNGLGIIGPIPPSRMTPEALKAAVAATGIVKGAVDRAPVHAIVTNSTYDGLTYDVSGVEALLGRTVDRLHFDEAWYGYARFNPLYAGRHAMHGDPADHGPDRPTVFATQSTHKLLAALSQASFIHVRDGRRPIPHARFNESFMMHASTSPNYAIIASNDVTAAMMDGPSGPALTGESIREAIAFRQTMARMQAEHAERGSWFFAPWQPPVAFGVPFHEADPRRLAEDPAAWALEPGAAWHGFEGLEQGWCMLDPIKVSVVTPGMSPAGRLGETGIPAAVVTAWLGRRGIVVEKTTDFTILFLFSLGVTKGKWGSLVSAFAEFKRDYDANAPLDRVLPHLPAAWPAVYGGMGLRDLADAMFAAMKALRTTAAMAAAFSAQPRAVLTPTEAYEALVRGDVEALPLDALAGRIVATGVVPYPPGIPLLIPGEETGAADGPAIAYLRALEAFDARFPGFGHDTHGVEVEDGRARVLCVKEGVA
jgi:arginine/lysine/ornithine decarboxylase